VLHPKSRITSGGCINWKSTIPAAGNKDVYARANKNGDKTNDINYTTIEVGRACYHARELNKAQHVETA
jgi:hypothetical protein